MRGKYRNRLQIKTAPPDSAGRPCLGNFLPRFFYLTILTLFALNFQTARGADGDLDPTFGSGGKQIVQIQPDVRDFAKSVAVQPDGKIIIGAELGDFSLNSNSTVLIRLNPDGSLDQTFGTGGKVINSGQRHVPALAVQPDGKIVTAGATSVQGINLDFAVVRYNANGSLDQTFGNGGYAINGLGTANALILQPDGKIVLVGTVLVFREGSDFVTARFNADGSPDQTFGTGGRVQTSFTSGLNSSDRAIGGALQTDRKIVVSGSISGVPSVLIRYNADGSVDLDFGIDGSVLNTNFGASASRVLVLPDGKIVAGGGSFVVGRYNPDGHIDHSFGNNGRFAGGFGSGSGALYGLALQADGKLVAAGSIYYSNMSNSVFAVARYNSNGVPDQSFGNGGFVTTDFLELAIDEAFAVALQPNGKIIAAGYASEPSGSYHDVALAQYQGTLAAQRRTMFDFDGDSRADISVFREGMWYMLQGTDGFAAAQFGMAGDRIVPADYDGDGKTDIAVFRPAEGNWYCLYSGNGTWSGVHFGMNGDVPAPGDYDADGRADYAVFRAGTWYVQRSSAGFFAEQFGLAADRPVAADYDGDGRTDIAVYRDGTWYIDQSSQGFTARNFGLAGDRTTAADYDGDGKADIAVWRPSEGNWYVFRSSDGAVSAAHWGMQGDIPAAADYDGDGRADYAVFRGNGDWWISQSGSGAYVYEKFGLTGDMPVPSSLVR
jgi:uncharacterized delta-60 repeat protein